MRDYSIHKKASQLFDSWQLNQDIFGQDTLNAKRENKERLLSYYEQLRQDYQDAPGALHQLEVLWSGNTQGIDPVEHVKKRAEQALSDFPAFIAYLEQNKFSSKAIYNEEESWTTQKTISKYNKFLRLLFMNLSRAKQNKFLYLLAQECFNFCFDPENKKMDLMVVQQKQQPIARMLYSVLWIHLCGRGWQSWHQKTINQLKELSRQGTEIVYIAGGSDINQLLKHNIYNIRVIDPFFPTQDTYYSQGWRFLVKGVIDDTIEWGFDTHAITLKRVEYHEYGTMRAELSDGKKRRVPRATIVWDIYDEQQKKCGQLVIERRFAEQKDFKVTPNKALLFSFNELYFVTTVHEDGWGIDINKFDPQFEVYVKQLSKPVTKEVLLRMQDVDQKFDFIQLGNCIT